jgi:glycosyltransferase involved in cell wall biosynthesis
VNPPETGLAIDPHDTRATAQALIRLLSAGAEWNQWSENARARYASRFTSEHFQNRLLEAMD